MYKIITYVVISLFLFVSKAIAQETFEVRAKKVADKIESVTNEEKETLKKEVEEVNIQLENGSISKEIADERKKKLAEARALIIENRVGAIQEELRVLVQDKVDGKVKVEDSSKVFVFRFDNKKKKSEETNGEKRTTSQFVFAMGFNNLVTDNAVANSDYRYAGSHFYEWGFSHNSRLLKDHNLLHAKYGLSLMYNNLRPTDNRFFVENGKETVLATSPINLKDSRFRNVYLVVPVHLEFDFTKKQTKDDKAFFRTHQSFRLGIGGYGGLNIKSKQLLHFEQDGNDVKQKTKGNFNVNDFIYGVSAYIGYEEMCLYAKYDINPLFKSNSVDQNNISLGVRFDFN